jgi:hypothetical protein
MSDLIHYIGGHLGALAVGAVTTATAAYLMSRPKKFRPLVDLDNQSQDVPVSISMKVHIYFVLESMWCTCGFIQLFEIIIFLKTSCTFTCT